MARKELKLLDSIPEKVIKLDGNSEFRNGFTDGASWRNTSKYREKHKRMIKKSLRSALKSQLDKDLRKEYTTPEIARYELDNEISLCLQSEYDGCDPGGPGGPKPPKPPHHVEEEQTPFY